MSQNDQSTEAIERASRARRQQEYNERVNSWRARVGLPPEEGAQGAQDARQMLGQHLPPSTEGAGVMVLWRCPECKRAWLQDGTAQPLLDLNENQQQLLADVLRADLAALPPATCPTCAQTSGVGRIEIDQYATGARLGGFGFNVEGTEPQGMHIMCAVFSLDWLQALRGTPHAVPVTYHKELRALVAWLAHMEYPREYHSITATEAQSMAQHNPPGHHAPGTERFVWRGADWPVRCPPLGGICRVSLAQAIPVDEPFSLRLTFYAWRGLVERIQAGRLAGEPEPGE